METESRERPKKRGKIIKTFPYHDESGMLLYEVCGLTPKTSDSARPDENGSYTWKLGNTRRVLYRLPEVIYADTAWICEGRKDADNIVTLGLCGTTSSQGAGKWEKLVKEYRIHEPLKGKNVVICPDNDKPGRELAETVAQTLHGFAASVKILYLSGLPEKGDVSDFIEQHGPEAKRMLLELAECTRSITCPRFLTLHYRPLKI